MKRPSSAAAALTLLAGVVLLATMTTTSAPTGESAALDASTALYCTGLGSPSTALAGSLAIANDSSATRHLEVTTVTGSSPTTTNYQVSPHSSISVPVTTSGAAGESWGASLTSDGPGVVATVATTGGGETPCVPFGETNWYAAGLSTSVGTSSYVDVYNPTDTPAVMNLTAQTPSGFSAPQPWQGVAVAGHATAQFDLSSLIVNTADFGVHVRVLRGSLVMVAAGINGSAGWLSGGDTELTTTAAAGSISTASTASATIAIANPSNATVTVTADVTLGSYQITPLQTEVQPYSSATLVVNPNTAIPDAGTASVVLHASSALSLGLLEGSTGRGASSWLTPLCAPSRGVVSLTANVAHFVITNPTGRGISVEVEGSRHEVTSGQSLTLTPAAAIWLASTTSDSLVVTPVASSGLVVGDVLISR